MALLHEILTEKILEACFEASNELGAGFLENVYQNALVIALSEKGCDVETEMPLSVKFRGQTVGEFFADIVVEQKVVLELKAV